MDRSRAISIVDDDLTDEDSVARVLSGDLRLPQTGERFACPIESLVMSPSLNGAERDLLESAGLTGQLAIVCDANTHDVLARRVAAALPGSTMVVLEEPKPDDTHLERLIDLTRHAEALVAVGAGTLNDLAKFVSHQRRRPYAVFATAPSMNGYVTATASITKAGEKLSLPAAPPLGAFFDLAILADAPRRLLQAGVGDSLCRSTAEMDWMLSHRLLDTPFIETPFDLQAADEARLLGRVDGLLSGDLEAVRILVRLLVLGGLGMLIAGSSQPGSQAEHMISHYIDMLHRPHPGSLHGEQVGLATRTVAELQHDVLTRDHAPVLRETAIDSAGMKARHGHNGPSCEAAMARKALSGKRLDAVNRRLAERWPVLQRIFRTRALSPARLQAAFDAVGVASDPASLGIAEPFYRQAVLHARELRDRFTILDLAADSGMLPAFVGRRWRDHV